MPKEIVYDEPLVKITATAAEDFEIAMLARNFVIGKYTVQMGTATTIISVNNQDEMLKQGDEYNIKTNPTRSIAYIISSPQVVKTVLHKEINSVNKTVTYMFQKYDNTFVKLTMASV